MTKEEKHRLLDRVRKPWPPPRFYDYSVNRFLSTTNIN